MANAIKWEAAWVSRGNVLTTEMNSLANAAYVLQSVATAIDNSTNLDQYGIVELTLASLSPTAGATVNVYAVRAPDGTNYEKEPGTNNPATHLLIATIMIDTTATSTKFAISKPFWFDPSKTKFAVQNNCGVAFGSSGNVLKLYTTNDELQ
jgi:hypothetical protein